MCQIPSPAFRHWEGFERGIWAFGCLCPAELPKGHGLKSLGESRSTKSLERGVGGRGSSALRSEMGTMNCGEPLRPQHGESQRRGQGQGGKHCLDVVPVK